MQILSARPRNCQNLTDQLTLPLSSFLRALDHFSRRCTRILRHRYPGQHPRHLLFPFIRRQQTNLRDRALLPNLLLHQIVRVRLGSDLGKMRHT